jgi:hypothetical protein
MRPRPQDSWAERGLDSASCACEVLAIVAYITADDGPLQALPDPAGAVTPWHRRLLLKAMERLDVIDAFMRARVAFLVAGSERGYHVPEHELELAGVALDTCRAASSVVDDLLAGRLPTEHEFDVMSRTALAINPALDAMRKVREHSRER